MAWYTDVDKDGSFELYIGQNGGVINGKDIGFYSDEYLENGWCIHENMTDDEFRLILGGNFRQHGIIKYQAGVKAHLADNHDAQKQQPIPCQTQRRTDRCRGG